MPLDQEIQQLPAPLIPTGLALARFVRAIDPHGNFEPETNYYVNRPNNFVIFDVRYQRADNITLSLRGRPDEFVAHAVLPLAPGMGGVYARCRIERPDQLDAASYYIRRALELFTRGRDRVIRRHRLVED